MQFSRVFVCVHVFVSLIVVVVCLANDENFKNVQRNSKHRFLLLLLSISLLFSLSYDCCFLYAEFNCSLNLRFVCFL